MSSPYLGQIMIAAFNFPPKGWAACNGQLLSISQNTALFSILGTFYGGNGVSNFALPNLQGYVPLGTGQGIGLSPYVLGQEGGSQTATLTEGEMPEHNHAIRGSATLATSDDPAGKLPAIPNANTKFQKMYASSGTSAAMDPRSIENTGNSSAHNNMMPYLTLNFVIALVGIYPSRS